jgi:hypothetical protein
MRGDDGFGPLIEVNKMMMQGLEPKQAPAAA